MTTESLIARAEHALRRPSTRSDYADALERGLALSQRDEAAGFALLRRTMDELASFRHIVVDEHGDVIALSMYVRGLTDRASWALDSSSTTQTQRAHIRKALALIDSGDVGGVGALEAAIA
ncbi:hypothetical protein Q9S36_06885 [Microbacterium sp. ARD31]|uniref:hypothetical protein n=1 Tax=Microbacterium sp. ARD31 TaxID=2962576 RepID=UPI0028811FD4|nr:hypothetical protein [Microbacterium sp. ARD31]MDT0179935.1 hypothetical protein [Microbacterium sp. ARD31]